MFKKYIKPGILQLKKNRSSSFIKIIGFSLGIGIILIINLFVQHELSYDKYQVNKERIFQLQFGNWNVLPPGIAKMIENDVTNLDKVVRLSQAENLALYKLNDNNERQYFKIGHFIWADTTIQDIFTIKLIKGNSSIYPLQTNDIIISESTAQKVFGDKNPIGQSLLYNNGIELTVQAVMKDINHSHLEMDIIGSIDFIRKQRNSDWDYFIEDDWSYPYYLLLKSSEYIEETKQQIKHVVQKKKEGWENTQINLTRIDRLYLMSSQNSISAYHKRGNTTTLLILISLSLFILIIASLNYINLSTILSKQRLKEIFIKKAIGSSRQQIIYQLLSESIIIILIALFFGFIIAETLLPYFNNVFRINLSMSSYYQVTSLLYMIVGVLLLSIISGIYPALYHSKLQPKQIILPTITKLNKRILLRKSLSIVQFTLSSFLIILVLYTYLQIKYIKSFDGNFNKENIITLILNSEIYQSKDFFKERVSSLPEVISLSYSCRIPGESQWTWGNVTINGITNRINANAIDPDFINLYNLKIQAGRNFDWERISDKDNLFILNQSAKNIFDLDKTTGVQVSQSSIGPGRIIGLIEDFHFSSPKSDVQPTIYYWHDWPHQRISIQVKELKPRTIKAIQSVWEELAPNYQFEYQILEDKYNNQYQKEETLHEYLLNLALIAILIAGLGLNAMISFITESRTKEIGIRKAIGAKGYEVFLLIIKETSKWLGLAYLISIPLAIMFLDSWLNNFANKVPINIFPFILCALILAGITLITISYKVYRLSVTNPVNALRYE